MSNDRFGKKLMTFSALGMLGAIAWWQAFFVGVRAAMGVSAGQAPIECLYSSSGLCGLISGVASLAGETPYEPIAFQASCVGFLVGYIIRKMDRPDIGKIDQPDEKNVKEPIKRDFNKVSF